MYCHRIETYTAKRACKRQQAAAHMHPRFLKPSKQTGRTSACARNTRAQHARLCCAGRLHWPVVRDHMRWCLVCVRVCASVHSFMPRINIRI